jgi:Zn-dependent protease
MEYLYAIPALYTAIVLHEVAHGYVAYRLGDPTPKYQGRLTLNPIAHLDLVGLIMMWLFRFGWAKPVQVNPNNFRDPLRGMMWVALAGPVTNVLVAFVALSLTRFAGGPLIRTLLDLTVLYNVYFAVFNILPIPPLDGSRILAAFSGAGARFVYGMERWGWVLLMLLVYTRVLDRVLQPMVSGLMAFLGAVTGLPTPL